MSYNGIGFLQHENVNTKTRNILQRARKTSPSQ